MNTDSLDVMPSQPAPGGQACIAYNICVIRVIREQFLTLILRSVRLVLLALAGWLVVSSAAAQAPVGQDAHTFGSIRAMAVDAAGGVMWCATDDGALRLDLNSGAFSRYRREQGLADNDLTAVVVDGDANAWFGTRSAGLSRCDGNAANWTSFNSGNSDNLDDRIHALAVDGQGGVWAGTYQAASRYAGQGSYWTPHIGWTDCNPPGAHCQPLWSYTVGAIAFGQDDSTWLAIDQQVIGIQRKPGGVAQRAADGTWNTWNTNDGLPTNQAWGIALDPVGVVWVATRSGAARHNGDNTWSAYTTANSALPDNKVNAIAVDSLGAVWLATDAGVSRVLTNTQWETYTMAEGLLSNRVSALAAYGDKVCFGADMGVCCVNVQDKTWTYYEPRRVYLPLALKNV